MAEKVIIVESPAKAKTIEKILGKKYKVISSKGHIRDLPQKRFGVKLETFEPEFEIIPGKETIVEFIKKQTNGKEVLLASDMDREGEAIAWHIAQILGLNLEGKNRVVFTEITPETIKKSVQNPRSIDISKVNAQLARRILDRIVGYKISPLLWKIIKGAMSAGRVQSAALKIICERERKRFKFVPKEFYKVSLQLKNNNLKVAFWGINGKKIKQENIDKALAEKIKSEVKDVTLTDVIEKETKKRAPLPFITSTLQQEAANRLGFSVSKTMKIAQALYEGIDTPEGHIAFITYMRTDSPRVSEEAKQIVDSYIEKRFGKEYIGGKARKRKKSEAKVQDAHECIRPVDVNLTPEGAKKLLEGEYYKLYKLIWERFVASQMSEAKYLERTYIFKKNEYEFRTTISHRLFEGFEKLMISKSKEEKAPQMEISKAYEIKKILVEKDTTKPPSRYTEASLVKTLETEGIGRPSTYATIISTLLSRKYIVKRKKELIPTLLGFVVEDFLTKKFPDIVDKKFTALMERELDEVEVGKKEWKDVLNEFYKDFSRYFTEAKSTFYTLNYKTDLNCESCHKGNYNLRIGKYGLYLNCEYCGGNKSLDNTMTAVLMNGVVYINSVIQELKKDEKVEKACPKCGGHLVRKRGKFGYYFMCETCGFTVSGYRISKNVCPKCGSLVTQRKSKKGKNYWACINPECDFMSWNEPTGEKQ